ncbi:low molecular weight phosphatase family protein, partial [Microbispora sp. ATCC PTA-5024]|uniref:arsenate reductase/protein-tyrosine-phosphatase family protein n=1 Tax=Microbispora sp. ATCC PTA-5024 TaxID=316330 RepID=UPI0003DC5715
MEASPAPARFRVLFVCTANICRSAMAERVAATALAGLPGLEVESAGTHARHGLPVAAETARALAEAGVPASGFASRPLTPELVRAADL